jgi:transposase-like protein
MGDSGRRDLDWRYRRVGTTGAPSTSLIPRMEINMAKPKTLQQAIKHFSDEQVCIDTVASLRWPDGPECPACGHKEHYYLKTQKRWKCKECTKQFSVKLGTIFEDSPISLDKWLVALWMLVNCRNGVSSYEVARDLGITQKSAWFVLHRLRLALQSGSVDKLGGPESEVEVDETYIGQKSQNMHKSRKLRFQKLRNETPDWKSTTSSRYYGKTAVMGMLDREQRKVRASVVPNVKRETLQNIILKEIEQGSKVYTDQLVSYDKLAQKYAHEVVNHLEGYVNGRVHTNGLENFWSLLKRSLHGSYVAVEPFHLFRYVGEQMFRYNNRKDAAGKKLDDSQRFELALSQVAGKRLTFAEVTGKVGETAF